MHEPASEAASPEPPPTPRGPGSAAVTFLVSLVSNLTLVASTVVLGVLASVVGWLPPRGRWMYLLARLWSRLLLASSGVRLEQSFESELDPRKGYVFMANHQSMYDIPVLIAGMPGRVCFMAKRSLFRIPIFGWSLAAGGFIPVDRGDREAARETFSVAVKRLEEGASLLIFPEETRSDDGELLPFKRGGVLLALRTGFPIVPVGICGTRHIRPKKSWLTVPGQVRVRYGAPIQVGDGALGRKRELTEQVRRDIERLIEPGAEDLSRGPGAR
ncbi:MAG: lysophospholipid acyltransferase family protein [Acidobacteriota bacterium]